MKDSEKTKLSTKYYKKDTPTNNHVWYYLLDKDGKNIQEFKNAPCFSSVTYTKIPKETVQIVVYHKLENIPYDLDFIERWIKQVNKLGFPCKLKYPRDKGNMEVVINLEDYTKKLHVNVTLQLIRYLTESYICYLPDFYFIELEKLSKPERLKLDNKFSILQEIHKQSDSVRKDLYNGANTNHMITYKENFTKPITHKQVFDKLAGLVKNVYDDYDYSYGTNWLFSNK